MAHIIVCALLMMCNAHLTHTPPSFSFLSDTKGCYTKNNIAYFGRNGTREQKQIDPLPGNKVRGK